MSLSYTPLPAHPSFDKYYSLPNVDVWQIDLSIPPEPSILSPDEAQRANRLLLPEKRQRFIASHTGLRLILCQYTQTPPDSLTFAYGAYGKPRLNGETGIEFNLAHSGSLALVVVALQPAGIDVEFVRPLGDFGHMAQIAFSPDEQTALAALPDERKPLAFFRTWTRKEAVMKAHGEGFRLARTFSLQVTDSQQTQTAAGCIISDIPALTDCVAALALRHTNDIP